MNGSISLDDMRVFSHVAKAGSFTKAAKALSMPKQTVSRRVLKLENALNVQLIHRTTRSMRLTEAGEAYAARCAELVEIAAAANRDIGARTSARVAGRLRISADQTFARFFLFDVIDRYLAENPDVTVDLLVTARQVNLVEEGFDAAIRIGSLEDSSLVARRLGPADIRYCASPAYLGRHGTPETPLDLRAHQCIVQRLHTDPPRWPFRGKKGPDLIPVAGRLQVNDVEFAVQATLAGHGIAVLPAFLAEAHISEGRLLPVLDEYRIRDFGGIYIVHPNERHSPPKLRAFVDLATTLLRDRYDPHRSG